ncbi:ATP-binding protein [Cellvibrio japonicus]|nr:ATP-binding protein [Cellvibrio japonicus]QEI11543.1 HAMP domain-containing histidine kinase [Cellvibrio japonicus]QEI15117.1 HAMP domain-containing histidine kinase [Cellvibrio japonicus]QEI18697.1 HAMP domain-containing histidine kinase [Cellvibrio japonicus]
MTIMLKHSFTLAAQSQQLAYWVIIRTLILCCLIAAVALCAWDSSVELPLPQITILLVFMCLVNLLTYFRLNNPLPVTSLEFFIQLLIDLLCLSLVFYLSGGANNPFISYFLVPICVSAATLSGRYTLIIAGISLISYSLLLFFHIPLPIVSPDHHHSGSTWNLHVLGMWLNFFISAGLITIFVVKMARDLRAQEIQLNRMREDELRDEQVMAVATLAAGTAHELGTPLSTMKLLLNEMRRDYPDHTALQDDLQLLQQQVTQCAATLRNLVHTAEQSKDGQFQQVALQSFCEGVIQRWQIMRPDATFTLEIEQDLPSVYQAFHPSVAQALINLLNNAANANPNNINIYIRWNKVQLEWRIEDEGAGISEDLSQQLGKSFIHSTQGLGIGFYITQATINRYGGKVSLHKRAPTGTVTQVILPLSSEATAVQDKHHD